MALQQAKQNSLTDMNTKEMCDSLTNLDEATALAIQKSLDKSMYESFRNLGGAIEQARNQSLSDSNKSDDSNMFESFRNLEDAMAMAMAASLEEEKGKQRSSNFGADNCILEGDEDSESEGSVELQQVVKSNSTRKMGKNTSGGDNNNSSSAGIVHVAEAAPDLERLARRHANRRFEQERVRANDGGGVTQSMNCGRTRRSGRRISDTDLSGQTEELVEEEGASSSRRVERRRSSADSLQGRSRRRSASERIELGLTQDLSREDAAVVAASSRRGSDESSSSTRARGNGERSSSKRTSFVGMVGNELKSGAGLINDLIEPTLEKVLGPPISSSRGDNNNSSRRNSMSSGGTTDDIDNDKVEEMHFAHGRRTSALLEDNPLDNKEKKKKGGSKKKLFGSIKKKSSSSKK